MVLEHCQADTTSICTSCRRCYVVLSGLGLKTEQYHYALTRYRFNAYVLFYNFGFVSAVVFGISRALKNSHLLSPYLSDGLVLCGSLPLAVNAVSVLTIACHGDEAVAVFNEAFSNMIGVFLSPLLIRMYLGKIPGAHLPTIFWQLIVRVLVPLIIGQLLRMWSKKVVEFREKYKGWFARAQKYLLVFIVYTIFCQTFKNKSGTGVADVFTVVLVIFILQTFFLTLAWTITHIFYRDQPKLRVVGLFGPVAKTIALGIPLIQSLFEHNPRVGVYTLPILIWHPMLLVAGSIMTPFLRNFIEGEVKRVERKAIDQGTNGVAYEGTDGEALNDEANEDTNEATTNPATL
jgi:sodium/bile acid cotransporter 7